MVDDKQPSVWEDIDVITFPTCREEAQKHGDASHPYFKYPYPDAPDNDDTDDEAWIEATDCPLESLNQHLM